MRKKWIAGLLGVLVMAMGLGTAAPASSRSASAYDERERFVGIAVDHLGVPRDSVKVTDLYSSDHNGVTHVYLRQLKDGEEVMGAEATVNIQRGRVLYSGSRFLSRKELADETGRAAFDSETALAIGFASVRNPQKEVTKVPRLVYQVLEDRSIRLVYMMQIDTPDHWWVISVDAENGRVVHRYDLIDHDDVESIAERTVYTQKQDGKKKRIRPMLPPQRVDDGSSYRVYAMPMESPNDGGRVRVHNPAARNASPFGWHDTNAVMGPEYTITRGNNVHAYTDTVNDNSPEPVIGHSDGGPDLDFDHEIPTFAASPLVYREAAIDNLFYWNNVMHDVTYGYGFDEEAGNFQTSNYTSQGRGGDQVHAEAQDGGGVLNANFGTPAEGQPGRMQMYLWVDAFDLGPPRGTEIRDGDLDGGVIAHEYGHGISNRLVGGSDTVNCLRTHDEREGEGWSDFWSYALTMRPGDDGRTPRGIGTYVVYQEGRKSQGIRTTAYTTNMKINPSTYDSIKGAAEPHGVGYVWATMLWDLYWNLVDRYGFNPNPYESWKTGGNNLAIQLVVDGMKFSVCQPGFEDARDAIIAADAALTGNPARGVPGRNECLIWKTFARRGLGINAKQRDYSSKVDGQNGFKVPAHCKN